MYYKKILIHVQIDLINRINLTHFELIDIIILFFYH